MAANINTAYQWAVDTCNADNVGYSQDYRNEQTVDGITYYDCSSFIWYALEAGGFDVIGAYEEACWGYEGNAITTAYLESWLLELGFTEITITDEWEAGDILWRDGHTEMVYSGRRTMGAHSSSYDLEDQVSINSSESSTSSWSKCFRYGSGASDSVEWIQGGESEYFTQTEMENNAICILRYFYPKGWTLEAIAGLCGNVQQESTFNPNLIEIGGTGHGLVQWTPPENLYDVLDVLYGSHSDWYLGEKQCDVIWAEFEESTGLADRGIEPQWYKTDDYPMSWSEWASSTGDPGELALAFQANYERPASLHSERYDYALEWYEFLKDIDPNVGSGGSGGSEGSDTTTKRKGFNFLLFSKRRYRNEKRGSYQKNPRNRSLRR